MSKVRKKILAVATFLMFVVLLFIPTTLADPDNVISFLDEDIHIEMGQNVTMNINCTINDPCDTVAVDNMSYDGTIITTETGNVTGGNLFENGTIDPIVTVDNTNGWITSIVWANETLGAGTTGTLANITWHGAGCGKSLVEMTAGGTAFNGEANATVNHSCNITVHPQHPIHIDVDTTGMSTINISWTAGLGADNYTVEVNTTAGPWTRGDAPEIANTSNLYTIDSELNTGTTYYYQVWSYNDSTHLYSLYNNSGSNTTEAFTTQVNLKGLTPEWNITGRNTSSDSTPVKFKYSWCNSSGIQNETMEVNMSVNSTAVVEYINVTLSDLYDETNSKWHNASNITVWYSGDNITYHPIRDDDGNGFGVGIDGGNNLTINWSNWYYDHSPFDEHGDTNVITENCSIYLRFQFNHSFGMTYGKFHNQSDTPWEVWIGIGDEIHDSDTFTVEMDNFNDMMNAYNEFPGDGTSDVARPPANLSAYIDGTNLAVYFYLYNMTPASDTWTQVYFQDAVTNERVEFTTLSTFGVGTEFEWGNTTYNWSINLTDGSDWTNLTFDYTTQDVANGANARYDVSNNDDVDGQDCLYIWNNKDGTYDGIYDVNDNGDIDGQDVLFVWNNKS